MGFVTFRIEKFLLIFQGVPNIRRLAAIMYVGFMRLPPQRLGNVTFTTARTSFNMVVYDRLLLL